MSNAYIPDQLDHMSRKELIEFAQTAHEENVRLVKRVKELESHNVKLESYNVKLANESHDYQQRCGELAQQNQQLLTYLEDAHSHIGHLAAHLAGRIADGARFEMATRADEWREYCEQLRKEQDD